MASAWWRCRECSRGILRARTFAKQHLLFSQEDVACPTSVRGSSAATFVGLCRSSPNPLWARRGEMPSCGVAYWHGLRAAWLRTTESEVAKLPDSFDDAGPLQLSRGRASGGHGRYKSRACT
ncbi:unnamed protein product [Prorocentrum cordatum]|uniref:Uncharacterized protein n=1 Tax=Prorocentrum cordatum TaxID=2364126 RepID=A0ABN9WZL5_9DINO|nr:unnamed protein product [Polarella glacialis]